MQKNKIAFIGLGRFSINQIKNIFDSNNWNIIGCVDNSINSFHRFQRLFPDCRIPVYDTFDKLRNNCDFDIVIISTTAPSHVSLAKEIINSDWNGGILIQKPISNSISEAVSLQNIEKNKNTILVDHGRRYSSFYNEIRKITEINKLGKLLKMEVNWSGSISMNGSHFIDLALMLNTVDILSVKSNFTGLAEHHRGNKFLEFHGDLNVKFENDFELDLLMASPDSSALSHSIKLHYEKSTIEVLNRENNVKIPKILSDDKGFNKIVKNFENTSKLEKSWIWFEKSMLATLGELDGYRSCDIKDALKSLEIIYAAYLSNEDDNVFNFPLYLSEDRQIEIA